MIAGIGESDIGSAGRRPHVRAYQSGGSVHHLRRARSPEFLTDIREFLGHYASDAATIQSH